MESGAKNVNVVDIHTDTLVLKAERLSYCCSVINMMGELKIIIIRFLEKVRDFLTKPIIGE